MLVRATRRHPASNRPVLIPQQEGCPPTKSVVRGSLTLFLWRAFLRRKEAGAWAGRKEGHAEARKRGEQMCRESRVAEGRPFRVKRATAVAAHALLLFYLPAILVGCRDEPPLWDDYFVRDDSAVVSPSLRVQLSDRGVEDSAGGRILEGFSDGGGRQVLLAADGNSIAREIVGVPREIAEVPYWGSWVHVLGAPFANGVVAAPSLVYRIGYFSHEGVLLDSLTEAPRSWRQAREPEQGEFAGATREEVREYLQGFSIITGLASIADSVLVVAQGNLVPADGAEGGLHPSYSSVREGLRPRTRRAEIYVGSRRVATDVPAPGEIVGMTTTGLLVLERRAAPDQGMLIHYRWK